MFQKYGRLVVGILAISLLLSLIPISVSGAPFMHNMIDSLEWSPDGRKISCNSDMGMVHVWNVSDNGEAKLFRSFDHNSPRFGTTHLSWHPDSNMLATGSWSMKIWNVERGEFIQNISDFQSLYLKWSPLGEQIALMYKTHNESYYNASDSEEEVYGEVYRKEHVILYNPVTQERVNLTVADYAGNITGFSWSPYGNKIVVSNNFRNNRYSPDRNNSGLHIWTSQGEHLKSVLIDGWVGTADWSPDGTTIVMGNATSLSFWNATTLEKEVEIFTKHSLQPQWFPDSERVVSVSEGRIEIWNRTTGELALSISRDHIMPISLSPDGSWIAAATYDSKICIWDTSSGKLVTSFDVPGAHGSLPSIEALPIIAIFVMCAIVMKVYSRRKQIIR